MNDQRLENLIGHLLRAGVLLAAAVVFAGGILFLGQHHSQLVHYTTFRPSAAALCSVPGIVKLAGKLDSRGVMQLGLLLLIATPVARVAMAMVGFHLEKDRMYVVVSFIVLSVLVFSLMHAT